MKKVLAGALSVFMLFALCACGKTEAPEIEETTITPEEPESVEVVEITPYPDAHMIELKGDTAVIDGEDVASFDYVRSYDPSCAEPVYSGTEPSGDVYIAHDIIYYPEIDESAFVKENYDGETEWVTHYTAEGLEDYIFSTLPVLGNDLPSEMMHSPEDAYNNPVLHITKAGQYMLTGDWNGQIFIDLGDKDETFTDENAKVTLIFDGADVTCTVAPAIVFYSVYECDNTWEDREIYESAADLTNAGAKIIIRDATINNVTGANVYRLLKPKYKSEDTTVQKKLWKTDGAFYSFASMLIDCEAAGSGILNITSTTYEGLDSELHLTINGGYITIVSQDDGINVNEDGVSVFTFNDGHLVIFAGQGAEGDVVDSNGFIDINGGFIAGTSPSPSDNMLDSDCGTDVSDQATIISSTSGSAMSEMMPGGPGERPDMPEGFAHGERPEMPEGCAPGDGMTPPEKPDGDPQI